jgi:transposase
LRKGDIVFMDNLRTHKIAGVREAIEAVGARVHFLPAYSPDLNPIEQAFSRLKAALRKGATHFPAACWSNTLSTASVMASTPFQWSASAPGEQGRVVARQLRNFALAGSRDARSGS